MKIISLALSLIIVFACCNSSESASTVKTAADSSAPKTSTTQADENWQSLFDGKTTKGWHSYGKTWVDSAWKVNDGALSVDSTQKGGKDLVTNEEFENYDLKLEWKIAPKGNSGIIFNVKEDPAKYEHTYLTGPEMQVIDNDGHPDGKNIKHRAGDLYDLIKCAKETVKPVGEWNEAEIILNKGKLELYLNGTNVVTTTMWDDNWWAMVKGSKFKAMPDFGKFKTGRIALQDHGNTVWYRNIRIKKL